VLLSPMLELNHGLIVKPLNYSIIIIMSYVYVTVYFCGTLTQILVKDNFVTNCYIFL
jgi:hypothetical protein